ncbi:MAG: hypothetical protein IJX81_04115 [Clostridia bacterium]|nr:hypothetical protein [Clostridia bacterium]
MVKYFLVAFGIFRKALRRFFRNVGERFLIWFQLIHERVKYRAKNISWVWKKVKLTKEQKRSIDKFYKQNYGKKIPYTYHRLFTGFTGNFDEKYIPEMLYAPYLERFLTDSAYGNVFTNKNTLAVFARGLDVKMPQNIVVGNKNGYYDKDFNRITLSKAEELLQNVGKVFMKKTTESCGGSGCSVANFVDGIDLNTNLSVSETLVALGSDFSVQEFIVCHESIRRIYPHSVNTFRVITYILEGEVYHCPIIMRIGLGGSFIDNASAGGIFIAVDDNGTLHKSAFTEYRKEFTVHPDTNIVFEGQKIEYLDKVINLAKRLQYAIPQVGVVNWDFTINGEGEPILIEANMKNDVQAGSIWLPQMAHGKGAFGDNTAKILQYIRRAKKMSFTKRKKISM